MNLKRWENITASRTASCRLVSGAASEVEDAASMIMIEEDATIARWMGENKNEDRMENHNRVNKNRLLSPFLTHSPTAVAAAAATKARKAILYVF